MHLAWGFGFVNGSVRFGPPFAAFRPDAARALVRLAVYTDYVYRREDGAVFAERAFALFVARLASTWGA
jgi:hypothetical protein